MVMLMYLVSQAFRDSTAATVHLTPEGWDHLQPVHSDVWWVMLAGGGGAQLPSMQGVSPCLISFTEWYLGSKSKHLRQHQVRATIFIQKVLAQDQVI